jgi:hypothetical protein
MGSITLLFVTVTLDINPWNDEVRCLCWRGVGESTGRESRGVGNCKRIGSELRLTDRDSIQSNLIHLGHFRSKSGQLEPTHHLNLLNDALCCNERGAPTQNLNAVHPRNRTHSVAERLFNILAQTRFFPLPTCANDRRNITRYTDIMSG